MATITIPNQLLEPLRVRAAEDRRSLDQELIFLLESILPSRQTAAPTSIEDEAEEQYQAWCRLGVWQSDRPADQEIHDILSRRTGGRTIEL